MTISFIRDKAKKQEFYVSLCSKLSNKLIAVDDIISIDHGNGTRLTINHTSSKWGILAKKNQENLESKHV